MGQGEIGIDPQGLPVVVDRLVEDPEPAWISPRLKWAGANCGIDLQGVPVHEHRHTPIALALSGPGRGC